jgi:hypothetical protein
VHEKKGHNVKYCVAMWAYLPHRASILDIATFQNLAHIISMPLCIGETWGGGGKCPHLIFLIPKNNFLLATQLKRGKQNWGERGGKGCMYVNLYPANVECMVSC